MKSIFEYTFFLLLILIFSCNQPKSESAKEGASKDSTETLRDTVVIEETPPQDEFYKAIDKFSKDFPNYTPAETGLIDTLDDNSIHWFLQSIERHRQRLERSESDYAVRQLATLPSSAEIDMIQSIRQAAFYVSSQTNTDIHFEEWNFDTQNDAERWMVLLSDSLTRNEYTKPPRYQWTEGKRLYLVSTRSAGQWFEWSDSLTLRLSGKIKAQLYRLYEPLDLKHFKKWQGPANSSVLNTEPHLFKAGEGPHYSYFYFVKQRLTGEARAQTNREFPSQQEFNLITSLHKPFTGSEQFNTIQETLVAIQCSIDEPALNSLNIVGKSLSELQELFGPILYEKEDLKVFGHSNRILIAKMDQDKVTVFKYLHLKEPFQVLQAQEDIMDRIISFE